MLDPFRPQSPEDVERLSAILHELHQGFKATVRERRGERLKGGDEELFEGQIWTGARRPRGRPDRRPGRPAHGAQGAFRRQGEAAADQCPRPWWQRRLGLEAWPRALVDAALDSLAERALWSRYGL